MTSPVAVKPRWQPRDVVGRYYLLAQIASGGMAEIWLARQAGPKGFEKVVAIKKMSDNLGDDADFVEMFLDEARIAAQLNHPNIVQVVDLGEHQGAYYIAMEYLNGENLAMVVRAGKKAGLPLPLAFTAKIIANAAEGLDHAHRMTGPGGKPLNIVHRDVSPQNILITYDGVVKVVDFGIAKAANRASHTVGAQLKGKMSYLSPEQAQSSSTLDARSDVFCMGIVLFEAITQSRLFQFDDPLQAIANLSGPAVLPTARSRNPAVPEALDAIVSKALKKNSAERYQSARELQLALEDWLKKQEVAPGAADVSLYMKALFPERLKERAALIESARHGELTPSGVPNELVAGTPPSMPGGTQAGDLPRGKPMALIAGGLAGLVVLGAAFMFAARNRVDASQTNPENKPPVIATLNVETDPTGAQLAVDGIDKGRSPLRVEGLEPGDHQVVAVLPNRPVAVRSVHVEAGEKALVSLTLAAVAPEPEKPPPTKRPAVQIAKGKLSLDTEPWTRVYLGERLIGETPVIEAVVPAGHLRLRLVNEEKGIKTTVEVDILPGKTTPKKLRL